MNMKKYRENINYNIGHKGYVVFKNQYVHAEVIGKTYYENGARKGSTLKFTSSRFKNRNREIIKMFSEEEVKMFTSEEE